MGWQVDVAGTGSLQPHEAADPQRGATKRINMRIEVLMWARRCHSPLRVVDPGMRLRADLEGAYVPPTQPAGHAESTHISAI